MGTPSLTTPISDASGTHVAAGPQPTLNPSWPDWARSPIDASPASWLPTAGMLPDPAICRAKAAGFGDYADCLVENPFHCPHALHFGYGNLCQNPQRGGIVLRTAAQAHAGVRIV